MDNGYYDCKSKKFVNKEEIQKSFTENEEFENIKKIHKCTVCENRNWCDNKEKNKIGCENEFVLDEFHIYAKVYEKQQK